MQLDFTTHMDLTDCWADDAFAYIVALPAGSFVDASDLRRAVGDPPRSNAMGAVFRHAKRQGLIRVSGFTTSTRPSRHGGMGRLWERV